MYSGWKFCLKNIFSHFMSRFVILICHLEGPILEMMVEKRNLFRMQF